MSQLGLQGFLGFRLKSGSQEARRARRVSTCILADL